MVVPKSVGSRDDFGHFWSSEQHGDKATRFARCDFLIVFYSGVRPKSKSANPL